MNQEPLLSAFTRLRDNLLSMSPVIFFKMKTMPPTLYRKLFAGYGLYEIKLKAKKKQRL